MKQIHFKKYLSFFKENSLARKMALVIVLSVVLISCVSSSIILSITARTHQADIEQSRLQNISFLEKNLQLPLWNCDSEAIEKIGKQLMKLNTVSFISINGANGELLFSAGNEIENDDFSQIKNIRFRGKTIGSFQLGLSHDQFIKQQIKLTFISFITIVIMTIGIISSVVFTVNHFLRKPLLHFSIQMKNMAEGDGFLFDHGDAVYLELKDLFNSFQQLVSKIHKRQKETDESNRSLQREIDKHKETERLLRESEEKYRSFNENIPVGFFRIGVDGSIIEYNSFLQNFLGISEHTDLEIYNGEAFYWYPEARQQMIRHALQNKKINGFECQMKKHDGRLAWVSISAQAVKDSTGTIQYIDGVFEDITEKKAREEKLLQFAKVIEQADEEVIITSTEGIIQYVNPSFERNNGYASDDVVGRRPAMMKSGLHGPSYYKELWETILANNTWKGVMKNKKKDGGIILHDTTISPIEDVNNKIRAFVSIRRDITRQKMLENQLHQSQKMQALGTLAGGIAHDFNNILSGIFGFSQLAQLNIGDRDKVVKHLKEIVKASERATELVQQILMFSRQTGYERKPFCAYLEIKEALKLIRSSIPANIKIENALTSRSLISADPTRIHQLVMNLCTNAYHAMKDTGGTLTVSLDDVAIEEAAFLKNGNIPPGRYLVLSISDTGCGMDAETVDKVFEPYFTTKKVRQGTGLGLSIVEAIVEEHDGYLDVSSTVGKGTVFSLYFPVVEREERKEKAEQKQQPELIGNETIMLVDDETAIQESYRDFFERSGFEVVTFSNGKEALQAIISDTKRFDIIVTDMAMPEKTGSELTQEIRKMNKEIPIIICSGFSDMMDDEIAGRIGADKYLMKPVQTFDLFTEVRDLLDQKKSLPI